VAKYVEVAPGRKRKIRKNGKTSRWGPVPKRKRWGGPEKKPLPLELEAVIGKNLNAEGTELSLLKLRLQETMSRLGNPQAYLRSIPENERSPSPQPIYDSKGVRLNSREVRIRGVLTKERDEILTRILVLNPDFKPPSDWKPPKIEKKIYVPVDEYPDYNFFGLIIGPRGTTIKRLQKETNTRIAIRGKGSFQEGKLNRVPQQDDLEPMHVLISGNTDEDVEKAGKMVQDLMVPVTESESEFKAKKFRQLALIQGTMVSAARCRICGGSGHPVWNCPERTGDRWTPANVQCAICGELSHVTADCKMARGWSAQRIREKQAASSVQTLEAEYDNFMKELKSSNAGPMGGVRPVAAITNAQGFNNQPYPQPQQFPTYGGYAPGTYTGQAGYQNSQYGGYYSAT